MTPTNEAEVVVDPETKAPEKEPKTMQELVESVKKEATTELAKKGVTPEMIAEWKGHYRRIAVVPIGEELYVIRSLSRREWRDLTKLQAPGEDGKPMLTETDIEEKLTSKTLIFPKVDELTLRTIEIAGLATTLSAAVMNLSGFAQAQPIVL